MLRIDDTDPTRTVEGGEEAIVEDLRWLRVGWDEGPLRQSERADVYAAAAAQALENGAIRDADGSIRLEGTTLVRPDGTATYQLATVADDLALGITHVLRGSDHRPNEPTQRRIARALGGELPEVIHHGLLARRRRQEAVEAAGAASVADLRAAGIPPAALRAYLEELDLPTHDVRFDRARLGRLAIDAIAAMPDDELAAAAEAPVEYARALRGARTLVEAREIGRQILDPAPVSLPAEAGPTLERFVGASRAAPERWTRRAPARSSASSRRSVETCARCGSRSRAQSVGPSCGRSSLLCRGTSRSSARAARGRLAERRGCRGLRSRDALAGHADRHARRAAGATRADRDVRLRPDGLSARPHRECAAVRRLHVARPLASRPGTRRADRPQHHGRERQDLRRGPRPQCRARGRGDGLVSRGHRGVRPRPARTPSRSRPRRCQRSSR